METFKIYCNKEKIETAPTSRILVEAVCMFRYYFFSIFFKIFLKVVKNAIVVTVAARISLTGSARNTAKTLSAKKFGKIKIKGINKIILRRQARKRLIFACPSAIKLC